jgi:hypothetical protein
MALYVGNLRLSKTRLNTALPISHIKRFMIQINTRRKSRYSFTILEEINGTLSTSTLDIKCWFHLNGKTLHEILAVIHLVSDIKVGFKKQLLIFFQC